MPKRDGGRQSCGGLPTLCTPLSIRPIPLSGQKVQEAMDSTRRYCLISPCRDEAAYARRSLDSVLNQSQPPALWVIVDDGSTDGTAAILGEYERRYPGVVRVVTRADRGERKVGPGVIDAFYAGVETVDLQGFDYICKIDLDLDLPPRYFELLMQEMEAEPRLGTASGKPYFPPQALKGEPLPSREELLRGDAFETGGLVSEACGDEMSVGMIKFYRVACFEQVGGFVREVMWDGIDCHRCRMLGWIARSWDRPELRFVHLRPMGSSQKGVYTGRMRHGFGQYFMGTAPSYMAASVLFRATRPPYVLGGLAMGWGYVKSALGGALRYDDAAFRDFLRKYQRSCLRYGKAEATRRLDEAGAARWNPPPQPDVGAGGNS